MRLLLGFTVLLFGFYNAIFHLHQPIIGYWDVVAFLVVVGGTVAVAMMTSPTINIRFIFLQLMLMLFSFKRNKRRLTVEKGIQLLMGDIPQDIRKKFKSSRVVWRIF
jgi:flagellar motor component MotA